MAVKGPVSYKPKSNNTRFGVYTPTPITTAHFADAQSQAKANAQIKKKSSKNKSSKKTSYNYTDNVLGGASLGGDYASGGGGGSYGGYSSGPDISALLAAYDQQADASRKIAQSTYDTTRNDLLTSLKRFQDQNAKDVANQKQSYLTEQSSLDYAREQANRQNRISASSRGLGGSGLQQLAQLQTLMGQSEDVSQAAASNQKAMDTLRQALQQKEEDTNSNLSKAQNTLNDALMKIEANLAQQKAEAALQSYGGGSGGSGRSGGSGGYDDGFDAVMAAALDEFNSEMKGYAGKTDAQVKKAVNAKYGTKAKTMGDVRTILGNAAAQLVSNNVYSGMSNAAYQNAAARAQAMANSLKGQGKKKKKKK